jgi:putative ABC transport system permease protein
MRAIDFVIKELGRRKAKLVFSILGIVLAIAIFVATQSVGNAMYTRTKEELSNFGANIIVQPKDEEINAYFGSLVTGTATIPELYVEKIYEMDNSEMLRAVSPKLYKYFQVNGINLLVTGITDAERKLKVWWRINNMLVADEFPQGDQVLLGYYAAARLGFPDEIRLDGNVFRVTGILDKTGSADDYMAFVPLKILQDYVGRNGEVNVIEIATGCIACPSMNIYDHAKEIDNALPDDAKVVTVKQIAEAQIATLKRVENLTFVILVIVFGLSVFVMINYMFSSVSEQKREIGALTAMGMDAHHIYKFFIMKALIIGLIGGFLGYFVGSSLSVIIGPQVANTLVQPLPKLFPYSIVISVVICIISSILAAGKATKLDPVEALRVI